MKTKENVTISKRAQVNASNKSMFIWVSAASAILGFSIVVSIFFVQMLMFNERVLQEKNKTVSILEKNNANIKGLKSNIRAIDANQALIDSKAKSEDQAVQVILDALPSEANELALGASLQNKLLNNFSIESLKVDSVSSASDSSVVVSQAASGSNQITFSFSINGTEEEFQQVLTNLEKSIRTVDITSLNIENGKMVVQARAFYEPTRVVELKDKTVK